MSHSDENIGLKNIRQLTFTSMGFEKAGEAYFSPDQQSIIFQAVPIGLKHYQIYTLKINEDKPYMVSTGKGACTCAYFRPDGKKIIFASSHEDPNIDNLDKKVPEYQKETGKYSWEFTPYMNIYEANLDGSELKALTMGSAYHAECAYSNGGSQIVYASNAHGRMNLYIMNADGSHVRQITHSDQVYNGGCFFSPDAKQIIYRADYERPHYLQIYCLEISTLNNRQLTKNNDVNWAPYWHPNGHVIAYTTSKHGHHNYQIYLMNINTNDHYRLTYGQTFDGLPSFSRDGSLILWTSKRGIDQTCQIFLADFIMPNEIIQSQ